MDTLVSDAQQRQSIFPCLLAFFAVGDRDGGIAIVVAIDAPFEAERYQRCRLGYEFSDGGFVGGGQCVCPEQGYQDHRVAHGRSLLERGCRAKSTMGNSGTESEFPQYKKFAL